MLKMVMCAGVVLFVVTSDLGVQTIDSEAQLASLMCRNPAQQAANELQDKNPQFTNIALWNELVNCASASRRCARMGGAEEYNAVHIRAMPERSHAYLPWPAFQDAKSARRTPPAALF